MRRRAAELFSDGLSALEVAAALEVSTKSAYAWRRRWVAGGERALLSKGPPGPDRCLSAEQMRRLEQVLAQGPAASGWVEDQRWTLARVATVAGRLFRIKLSIATVSVVLRRMSWSVQQPKLRAAERDDQAIAHWGRHQWPAVKGSRAGRARGSSSPTSPASR